MRKETSFSANVTVLKQETVLDVINSITSQSTSDEPFFILDVGDIVKKIKVWRLKLPRVEPFYAVKCNDNPTVLEILASLDTGFDCASKGEMQKVLDLGVDPSRIIYAHPCKPISHVRQAAKLNVSLMTFDNEAELHKINRTYPDAKLVIRIRCDAAKVQCDLGVKFGVQPEDALPLLETARKLGLDIVGVSFHVGSGCQEPAVFKRAISASRMVFDLATAIGFNPYLLDIGGGFPGNSGASLDELAHYINTSLDQHFPVGCGIRVIAEPGRYVVASAFTLVTSVVSRRDIKDEEGNLVSAMYYINDGVYGSFNCILYDHQEVSPKILKNIGETDPAYASSIWGPTCDGLDQVVSEVSLPLLELGDWIMWDNMGAYTLAAANTFNGFPLPSVHVVVPHHTWLFLKDSLPTPEIDQEEVEGLNKAKDGMAKLPLCSEDNHVVNKLLAGLSL